MWQESDDEEFAERFATDKHVMVRQCAPDPFKT
jgi:hypothetical protein